MQLAALTDGRKQTRRREVHQRCTERRTGTRQGGRGGQYCPMVSEPHTVSWYTPMVPWVHPWVHPHPSTRS